MSLPIEAIDRLFARLAAVYGAAWDRSLGQSPIADVKAAWRHELQGFHGQRMEHLAWALDNLPERPPNVIEFRNLARRAPRDDYVKLPEPMPDVDPEEVARRVALVKARLAEIKARVVGGQLQWARAIVQRHKEGDHVSIASLRMAQQALARRFDAVDPHEVGVQPLDAKQAGGTGEPE